jgi:xanthine dehydrogenase accessory factor
MDQRETERILDAVRNARIDGEPLALATIVRVRGSAYRREGTRMIVRRDGTYDCSLSGGCLEPAVAEAAARVIATGEPAIVCYDLADDSVWGLGMGCSGAVDVLIERLDDDPITHEWFSMQERADAAALVTPLSGVSGRMIVPRLGDVIGGLSDPVIEQAAISHAQLRLNTDSPPAPEWLGTAEIFFDISIPPPELVIFGAGDDVIPIASLAWTVGLPVTVVDAREALLTPIRFPHATLVHVSFNELDQRVTPRPGSFFLVMNHQLERDQQSLRFSLDTEAAYIGMLGPRSRYEKVLAALAQAGYIAHPSKLARVRSPVGLSLGAETPQEVAVSILAEILAVRRRFQGGFLSGSVGSLHRSAESRILARS